FVLAFPQLPLYLALTSLIPVTAPSNVFLTFVIFVMAVLGWAQLSREVRSKTLSLARIDYVRAAIAVGSSDARIITRHILPNVLSHIIVSITLAIPSVVLLESFLGFLGFAVKPPLISWGLMLQDTGTFSVIGSYPWILSPVIFVLITVFAFNALGDGLRDAIVPYCVTGHHRYRHACSQHSPRPGAPWPRTDPRRTQYRGGFQGRGRRGQCRARRLLPAPQGRNHCPGGRERLG